MIPRGGLGGPFSGTPWEKTLRWASIMEEGVLAVDADGVIAYANPSAERAAMVPEATMAGQRLLDLLDLEPPSRARLVAALVEHVESARERGSLVRRGGGTVDIAWWVFPVEEADGSLLVFQDLSQNRKAEEAIHDREERLRAVFEAAIDCIITIDERGIIESANPAIQSVFGYAPEEVFGRNVSMLMPQPYRSEHDGYIHNYLSTGRPRIIGIGREVVGLRKDGSTFPMHLAVGESRLGARRIFTGIIHDVTDRKRAEEELRRAREELEERVRERTAELETQTRDLERSNAELQQFANVASHDLQEPLRTVVSYAQLLARRYGGSLGHDADEFIGYVVDGSQRMQRLILDLLAFSRVGAQGLRKEDVQVPEVVAEVLHDLQGGIEEAGARVVYGELPAVHGDRGQIAQLFQNLIGNSLKFRSADRPALIQIEACRSAGEWVFSVRDNGIGIAPEYRERIFQIFQRLHTREQYPGSGIGLSICKKIVEGHGGRIWVESDPGEGAEFLFTLPSLPAGPQADEPSDHLGPI